MVNICESVIKIVSTNKRKWFIRLNQKVRRLEFDYEMRTRSQYASRSIAGT